MIFVVMALMCLAVGVQSDGLLRLISMVYVGNIVGHAFVFGHSSGDIIFLSGAFFDLMCAYILTRFVEKTELGVKLVLLCVVSAVMNYFLFILWDNWMPREPWIYSYFLIYGYATWLILTGGRNGFKGNLRLFSTRPLSSDNLESIEALQGNKG